jgi:hypothetical protein
VVDLNLRHAQIEKRRVCSKKTPGKYWESGRLGLDERIFTVFPAKGKL